MKVLQKTEHYETENYFENDETLQLILREHLKEPFLQYAVRELESFGHACANEIDRRAVHTDREGEPRLIRYNKFGEEVSEVWVNEGYRQTVQETYDTGIVGYVHKEIPELGHKGNYTYSFAQGYLLSHAEPGFYCPVTLTMATAYLLEHYADEQVKELFLPHVCSTGEVPLFEGATFLTERQGGSDVGANVVRAVKEGEQYLLYGEKYFASNAGMAGVAMVLARMDGAAQGSKGLTLFAVPWRKENGELNGIRIRRLKDKLGVRAVPSGEVEFDGAIAYVVGDPSKGLTYMLEALNLSRICNAVASLGIMRRALLESKTYASRRNAFGQQLTDYPMVRDSLSKLTAKLHAEMVTVFDFIKLYERVTDGKATQREQVLNRLFIALIKKETAEQAIHFSHEAIELHGGNGYIEDFVTPRLLRDAQVLTVWEGTANILALELIRLINKYRAHELFIDEMKQRVSLLDDGELKQTLVTEITHLETGLNAFATYDYSLQTYEAKRWMKQMIDVYESVVSLEWSAKYGDKFEKLAELFIENTWKLRKSGGRMKTVEYYEEII
ncbi:acyl-CoA dehydrogenase family protein [Sporosarcina obsidiansis]|uniref:acyl-CoA dehydrogenase family protein n=1 Tax=Sporosarcina obsidiansis TaxID=2660748 RepID=UPI00129BD910|nr:acyl-CoA dehydrogenase family protein [Sporosarcina obsidiansis]